MAIEKTKKTTKKPMIGKPVTGKAAAKKPAPKKKVAPKTAVKKKTPAKTTAKKTSAAKPAKKKQPVSKTVTKKPVEKVTKSKPPESSVVNDIVENVAGKVSGVIESYRSMEESKGGSKTDVKADVVKRLVAKFVDLLIAYVFVELGTVSGFLLAVTYILTSDGFSGGSIGKRLMGVKVVTRVTKRPVNLMESAIRNAVFAAVIVVYFTIGFIPYIGKLIALASVIAIGVMEVMLIFNDKDGIRYGDKLAGTMVIDKN